MYLWGIVAQDAIERDEAETGLDKLHTLVSIDVEAVPVDGKQG